MSQSKRHSHKSIEKAKRKVSSSNLDEKSAAEVNTLIDNINKRLNFVEIELIEMHKRMAFGQVNWLSDFDYQLFQRKRNLNLHQIVYALEEKVLRSIIGSNNDQRLC